MRAGFLAAIAFTCLSAPGALAAGTASLVVHLGDADPQTEGWTRGVVGSIPLAATFIEEFGIPDDQVLYPVWAVDDPIPFSSLYYRFDPTAQQLADALAAGFTVRWWFRIVPQFAPIDPSAGLAALKFGPAHYSSTGLEILFGATAAFPAGGGLRMLVQDGPPEIVFPGASLHRLVEAVYDPVAESFDVLVDGAVMAPDVPVFGGFLQGASLFFGSAGAGAQGQVNTLYAELEINLPDCDDGLDNDGDGLADLADPGCAAGEDLSEEDDFACNDDQDNDSDGLVDLLDPGCMGPGDDIEFEFGPGAESWRVDVTLTMEQLKAGFVPPLTIAGTGVAPYEVGPGGTAYLGVPQLSGITSAAGITGNLALVILSASVPPATVAVTAGGPRNAMPVHGFRRLCFANPDCSISTDFPTFQPIPKAGLGVGGDWDPVGSGSLDVAVGFAPWTLGTASGLVDTGPATVTSTRMGFAHGPLSATSTLPATSGVIQLVTPTQIDVIGGGSRHILWFHRMQVRFVPEPRAALLLGGGALLTLLLGKLRSVRGRAGF